VTELIRYRLLQTLISATSSNHRSTTVCFSDGERRSSEAARLIPIWDHVSVLVMRIIAVATLKSFLDADPARADARQPVMAWYRQVKAADWSSPTDVVKREIRNASILKDGRAVFNIAGNKYRIVVWINYPYRVVYIRFIGNHRDYDAIDAQTI